MRICIRLLAYSIIFYISLFIFSIPQASADNSFESQLKNQSMDFTHYTKEQGLSQSNVYAMLQDKTGFLWIGTDDGLNKFDGYTFTVYKNDPVDQNSLSNNQIIAIQEDANGILWIATYRGGLNKFNPATGKFTPFFYNPSNPDDPKGLSHENINAMKIDKLGNLWIGTGRGLDKFNITSQTFTHYVFDKTSNINAKVNLINSVAIDDKAYIWLGTSGGLIRFDSNSLEIIHYQYDAKNINGISDDNITSLAIDEHQNLWIGTQNAGLNRLNLNSGEFERFTSNLNDKNSLLDNKINVVYADNEGIIWICSDKGLNQWDENQGTFKQITHDILNPQSLSGFYISSVFKDRQHNLWVSTEKGLDLFSPKSFLKFEAEGRNLQRLLSNTVYSMYEAKDGLIWLGTNEGLQTFDREKGSFGQYLHDQVNPHSVSNGVILSIFEDSQGTLWVGTREGGLNRFNADTQTFSRFNDVTPDRFTEKKFNTILKIGQKNEQELWIATYNGLFIFDKVKEEFHQFIPNASNSELTLFGKSRFTSVITEESGITWLGTLDSGLFQYDPVSNQIKHFPVYPEFSNNLGSNSISMIHQDKQGILWLGTKAGLERFTPSTKQFERFTEKDGLPNNLIWAITEDDTGRLWMSTENGLSRYNPKTRTFNNYDQTNGLQSNSFFSRSFLKTRDGDIFFGGNNGFNWFRPSIILDNGFKPPIVINSFKVFDQVRLFDQPLSELKTIKISYKENFFSFEFAALDYRNTARIQYAYKLDGLNKDWVYSINRRYVSYMNLKGGHYVLHIKATNSDGVWNAIEKTIELDVISPWWLRWWAYVSYVSIILLVIVIYLRFRTKQQELVLHHQGLLLNQERVWNEQLREMDQLKDEFLANTSHELRTPLNGMIGLAQTLIDGSAGNLNALAKENLEIIVSSGNRLTQLINDLLDLSLLKGNRIHLYFKPLDMKSITDVVMSLLQPLTYSKNLRLINNIHSESYVYADEHRVQQIMYNLIGNAIKFTEQGQIEVHSRVIGNVLEITVSDTGIGIAEKDRERIFESFVQIDGSIQRSFEGTGLGLSITHKLIDLQGGTIRVESQLGKGSKFLFTLPLSEEIPVDSTHDAGTNVIYQDHRHFKLDELLPLVEQTSLSEHNTILIIEDDPINLKVLQNQLIIIGYKVISANDGLQALQLLEQGHKPDLIVMDIMMPKMSGYELTRIIRKQFTATEVPILLLSAKSQTEDIQTGFEMGANDYLVKPANQGELQARIKLHLQVAKWHQTLEHMVAERTRSIQSLLDHADQGFLSFGADLKICRDYSLECVRFLTNDLEGRSIHTLLYPNQPLEQDKLQQQLLSFFDEPDLVKKNDRLEQLSCELLLNNYTVQLVFKQIFNLDDPKDTKCMLIITNLSKLRHLETQMEQSNHIFTMEKLAVLGQLAAGIAHEIRNPLTVIDGFMQIMLKNEFNADKSNQFLALMHTEVKRINELVSEFLMLAKPVPVKFQPNNIYAVLKETLEFMSSEASLYNIGINYSFGDKALFIEMDSKQMKQVFMNIIKNAIEASQPGSQVHVQVLEKKEHVEFIVSDQGEGISEDQLRKIFDPFFTKKDTGTGLGLTTSVNIVRNHHGVIDVASKLGVGTSVTIKLPLQKQE